ncbi:MAG: 2-C-methyl-D-erythritol 2,4-cyclodiphosphate synthase [Clostridiaceae bacterium]|nr:2-C-methyl-D-erythritol 2,4-cyclodiphosphate synthase [Clostridiaceae bacterium]
MNYTYYQAIGQDSHRFININDSAASTSPLILGGIVIPSAVGIEANSDGDVLFHALTNAISGVTGVNILGKIADQMCLVDGVKDSRVYLERAMQDLKDIELIHVSFSIECLVPKLAPHIQDIKTSVASALNIAPSAVGITATTGEGLNGCGRGEGIAVLCVLSVRRPN